MRQQFATEINIKIAQYAAHFVKNFRNIVQDEAGLAPDLYIRDFGYLYLADNEEFALHFYLRYSPFFTDDFLEQSLYMLI